jgi:hypothetical protein
MKKLMFIIAGVALVATAALAKSNKPVKEKVAKVAKNVKAKKSTESTAKSVATTEADDTLTKSALHHGPDFLSKNPITVRSREKANLQPGFHSRGTPGAATKGLDSHNR